MFLGLCFVALTISTTLIVNSNKGPALVFTDVRERHGGVLGVGRGILYTSQNLEIGQHLKGLVVKWK